MVYLPLWIPFPGDGTVQMQAAGSAVLLLRNKIYISAELPWKSIFFQNHYVFDYNTVVPRFMMPSISDISINDPPPIGSHCFY
jgi:hypothetical protein